MYRRASTVAAFWAQDGCRARNYARGTSVALSQAGFAILNAAISWCSRSELGAAAAGFEDAEIDRAIADLAAAGVLQRSSDPLTPRELALGAWDEWSPAAALFHLETRDLTYATREAAYDALPLRMVVRSCPGREDETAVEQLPLSRYPRRAEFPSVLLARRSWRQFGGRPLAERDLAALLGLTWGTQRWIRHPANFEMQLKTSPSPGALHSIGAYVCVRQVAGVPPGLYRYLSDSHGLARVGEAWSDEELTTRLGNQSWIAGAAAVFFLSSRFDRVQWKYPYPRTYRSVLMEAGHFCQTFCLVATWLKLAPFCTAAFSDSAIEATLGLDGVSEAVLYAMGVGTRPRGVGWAPVPDGAAPPTRLAAHLSRKRQHLNASKEHGAT